MHVATVCLIALTGHVPALRGAEERLPLTNRGKPVCSVFVVGPTPRGVFNGAIYLREFLIDGLRDDLYVRQDTVVRSPRMGGRGVYLLTIWGNEAEYTAKDWQTVLDSFARDGMDRVYFWV